MTLYICVGILFLFMTGCDFSDMISGLLDVKTDTVRVLDDAIDKLEDQSSAWQSILQDTTAKLTKDAQATIRNEISALVSRSVAHAGVEFRCDADFVGTRVRQALIGIKAKFLGQAVPLAEPSLCQVVPIAIDRESVPEHIRQVEFYGYDLSSANNLRVFLERSGSNRSDVTNKLDRPTHYAMTLKFGASGVQLDNTSERFILEWDGRPISTIAIIQPTTPICREKVLPFTPGKITYTPPRVGSGDSDFKGHGPQVIASVSILIAPTALRARVYMNAKETKSDWTQVSGQEVFPVYNVEPGWRIEGVNGPLFSHYKYTDSDHEKDSFNVGSGGPVKNFAFIGDTKGDEAGSDTQVEVTFNQLAVELVEAANCVSASKTKTLRDMGLIRSGVFNRLSPGVEREIHRRGDMLRNLGLEN
jgi:hypothetical protein